MARQKSENRVVPKGRRKPVRTRRDEPRGGGKAVPVNEEPRQLRLHFETAEDSARAETDGGTASHRRLAAPRAEPKSKSKNEQGFGRGAGPGIRMESAFSRRNAALPNSHWDARRLCRRNSAPKSKSGKAPSWCGSRSHWDRRGRDPAGCGGQNPQSRRAVCEQHKYGSVRGAPRNGGPYSMTAEATQPGEKTARRGYRLRERLRDLIAISPSGRAAARLP